MGAPAITVARLIAVGVHPTQARTFAPLLESALPRWGVDTRKRQAAFLAQAIHESAGFARLEENLWYTTPERIRAVWPTRVMPEQAPQLVRNPKGLANRVYAGRLGNGDESSGDGFRYRGRGIFQLTGRLNYRAAEAALRMPYEANPDIVAHDVDAVLTECWFWSENRCNGLADSGDHGGMCKAINGPALAGLRERTALYRACFEALAA